jgi:hypothetical protein
MTGVSLTDQITAWATLLAVLVALGLGILPAWWRRHKRPVLQLAVGATEPYRIAGWTSDGRYEGSELRIAVTNKSGLRQAENVRAQILRVLIHTPNDKRPWSDVDFGITPLVWATRKSDQKPIPFEAFVTVIPSGLADFVEFAFWDGHSRPLRVRDALRVASNRALERFSQGHRFMFQVAVSADEIRPKIANVCVSLSDSIESVDFVSEPDPELIQKVALFATFYADNEDTSGDEERAQGGNSGDPGGLAR